MNYLKKSVVQLRNLTVAYFSIFKPPNHGIILDSKMFVGKLNVEAEL